MDGRIIRVGSRRFMQENAIELAPAVEAVNRLVRAGENIVYVAEGGELLGVLGIQDALRENMKKAINRLRYTGIDDIVLLTGDVEQHAEIIADRMTVDRYRAEAMPDDKAETVLKLQSKGTHVVMVGDGINDAPALAYADVGIAMGGTRTDIAMEAADITVTGDDPLMIPAVIHLANRTMQTIRQNFAAAVGVNTLGLVLASIGVLPVFWGAVLHNSCTVAWCSTRPGCCSTTWNGGLDERIQEAGRDGGSFPSRPGPRAAVGCPRDVQRMLAGVREHPGMESISFSPVTRSILARFNPHEISQEEIVLRIAFHLSLDCDSAPVRLLAEPEQRPALGGSAAVSAAAAGRVARNARTEDGRRIADAMGLARRAWHGRGGGRPRLEGAS